MKPIGKKQWIIPGIATLVVLFIWHNSMQNGFDSDSISERVTWLLYPYLNDIGIHGSLYKLNKIIRKIAHVVEFTLLGASIYVALRMFKTELYLLITLGIGFCVASLDEFIQIFSPDRSSQFSDILLDTFGVFIGFIIIQGFIWLKRKFCKAQ